MNVNDVVYQVMKGGAFYFFFLRLETEQIKCKGMPAQNFK